MAACVGAWDWLLRNLGYADGQVWDGGHEWVLDGTSVILSTARMEGTYDRRRPGLSHLAFHAGPRSQVDRLWNEGPAHGWTHLYENRHPFAGGADWYAAYMENVERFKIELVADS